MSKVNASSVTAVASGVVGAASLAYMALSRPRKSSESPDESKKKTMKKLFLDKPSSDLNKVELVIKEVEIPTPGPGDVLVRMSAAPVNPSDYLRWLKREGDDDDAEWTATSGGAIGFEGAGVVVASGGGVTANRLVGKKVGVLGGTGTYAEYVCVNAMQGAFRLSDKIQSEDGSSFFVNPFTVLAILDTAASNGSNAFIHTAAASQLGQMMVKVAPSRGMTLVNVVRRQEQVELLRDLGAEYIVCTSDKDWKKQLSALIEKLDIKVAFDAISGEMPGDLVALLPPKGTCFVYGGLSKQSVGRIDPLDLIYGSKQVKGFMVGGWIQSGSLLQMIRRMSKAMSIVNAGLVKGGWAESQFVDCRMEDMQEKFLAMWNSTGGFTGKKLRIRMD